MENKVKNKSHKLFQAVSGFFLLASVIIFVSISFLIKHEDLEETYALAEQTASLISTSCRQYDEYTLGNSAKSMQELLDKAVTLDKFILDGHSFDDDLLKDFIRAQHIGGVIVLDAKLNPLAQADMDDNDAFSMWSDVLGWENTRNILDYHAKSYVDHINRNGIPYDFAAVYCNSLDGLILCYASTQKPNTDPYEVTIRTFLANNSFYKNPMVIVSDNSMILSSNVSELEGLGVDDCTITKPGSVSWNSGRLTHLEYDDETWYGIRQIYNGYSIYLIYPRNEVLSSQTNFIAIVFMTYLAVCVIILAVQRHFDKSNLRNAKKQLNIINAANTIYASTILMHIDKMELEPIKLSNRLSDVFGRYPQPTQFIDCICRGYTDPGYQESLTEFLDISTVAERMKNCTYLEKEVLDADGKWFSILLIPQRYDASNTIQAFLITTRDITDIKHAEELSFKDKLTGLYNRNYLELKAKQAMPSWAMPITLIMADCNYLKKTNDTMGHEYGDLLIERVAQCISEAIPEGCTAIRVGGDEFVILCRECPSDRAAEIVAKIKRLLTEKSDDKLTLSVAFGVHTTENEEFSFDKAYYLADKNMYSDKQKQHAER